MTPGIRKWGDARCCWILLASLLCLLLPACQGSVGKEMKVVKIALPALEQNALIYIAEDQGYFRKNGLDVSIQYFDTGAGALNSLLAGNVDIAVAAEFPVVRAILDKNNVSVLASIDKFENDFIVARQDRGINNIADLKGKRVGVALQSINAFYLARFLELNGLQAEDVIQVDLKPDQFVSALASGQVDALIAWQPYVQQAQEQVQAVVTWPAQSSQMVYGLLITQPEWLLDDPEAPVRFLKALLQSEEYLARQPEAAKKIVEKQLDYSDAYLESIWVNHTFSLSLDNSLIVAMKDEARWLVHSGLSAATESPQFYEVIFLDGLEDVKPEAVDILR